jgi:hypothetical protein
MCAPFARPSLLLGERAVRAHWRSVYKDESCFDEPSNLTKPLHKDGRELHCILQHPAIHDTRLHTLCSWALERICGYQKRGTPCDD